MLVQPILKMVGDNNPNAETIETANTKYFDNICTMLDQRRIRWAVVVQMSYNLFVFAG